MQGFESNLYRLVKQCHLISQNNSVNPFFFPRIVSLKSLRCNIAGSKFSRIDKIPYFDFFSGKRNSLVEFIETRLDENAKQKISQIGEIFGDSSKYLEGNYAYSPIVVNSELHIIDGCVRAARLMSLGATHIVVVEQRLGEINHAATNLLSTSAEDVDKYVLNSTKSFKEWYSPLNLGPYKIPKRTFPDFNEVWEYDESEGIGNWNGVIKNVMPLMAGKKVLDIGCNIGLYSIEMARMGADICGVDRGPKIYQPNNHLLGEQSVPNQAYVIKNINEFFYKESIPNVAFAELDLMDFDFTHTTCDLFFSCRVLYHLGKERMSEIIFDISKNIPEIILQANEGHSGTLGKIATIDFHKNLLKKCGYKVKSEFAPTGSMHPIVYAVKV